MGTMKIVRFLDYEAAKQVLKENSTFCLRSLKYYQLLEERGNDTRVGDKQESRARFRNTRRNYEYGGGVLVSCWCLLDSGRPFSSELPLSENYQEGMAIISNIERVASFLQRETAYLLSGWDFHHEEVKYYSEEAEPKKYKIDKAMFWKREIYRDQHEYRLAFTSSSQRAHLQTLIFYSMSPSDYIDEIHFAPSLVPTRRSELIAGAIESDLTTKIHDFDGEVKRSRKD
jgi:hypothetical protein